jgi:hypothetical protein
MIALDHQSFLHRQDSQRHAAGVPVQSRRRRHFLDELDTVIVVRLVALIVIRTSFSEWLMSVRSPSRLRFSTAPVFPDVVYNWQHYLPLVERKPGALRNGAPFADLPDPLQRLRRALLRHEGGDKVMARVLMAVPTHGVDAVLVAVELVLESGRPSADHVLNVIARLTDSPPAPTV